MRGRVYCARACVYVRMRAGVYRARGHALVMFASKTDLAVLTRKHPFKLHKYPFGFFAEKLIAEFKKGILIFTSLGRVKKNIRLGVLKRKSGFPNFLKYEASIFKCERSRGSDIDVVSIGQKP